MNYHWDWMVFFKSTGVGSEIYLNWFVTGLGWTIAVALAGWAIALALGSVLGVMRTVPNRWVAGIATAYVELFRNVPLLVQLFVWYFLIPDLLPEGMQTWFKQDLAPATSAFCRWWCAWGCSPLRGCANRFAPASRPCRAASATRRRPWVSPCRRSTATCCCRRLSASSSRR